MTQIELVNGLMETFNKYCYFLNKQIREQFHDQIDKLIADLIERDDEEGNGSAVITRAYYTIADGTASGQTITINPELLTGSIIELLKKQCYSFAKWSQAYDDPDDIHEAFFDEFNGCVPDFTNEIMEYIKEATAESQED